MELIPLLTAARLLIPLSMLRFRFLGLLLSIGADTIDWLFLKFTIPSQNYYFYQKWDKGLDLYMFTIATYVAMTFKDQRVKWTVLALYILRTSGDIIFFTTGFQKILLFTPNFLETFLIFYLAYVWATKREVMVNSYKQIALILCVIAITKLSHEYMLHVLRVQPWDLFDLGTYIGLTGLIREYFNYIMMGGLLLHLPPLLLWIYWVIKYPKKQK